MVQDTGFGGKMENPHIGMRVRIYDDPFTSYRLQGEAILVKPASKSGRIQGLHFWVVRFPKEHGYWRKLFKDEDIVR